jgi:hypothetical protein
MSHIINRLELELNCTDEEQAFNMRHNFAITLQEKITTAVDNICSKYIRESEWIRIDRLELDLGWFNPNSFELEFGEIFQKKFEAEILRYMSQLSIPEKMESRQRSQVALFKHFIQYGTLPWWADTESTDINEIAQDLWEKEEDALKDFFYQHRFEVTVWQRAAFQLNHQNKLLLTASFAELQHGMDLFKNWVKEAINLPDSAIVFDPEVVLKTCNDIMLRNAGSVFETYPATNKFLVIFDETMRLFFPSESVYANKLIRHIKSLVAEKDPDIVKNTTLEQRQNMENKISPLVLFPGSHLSDDQQQPSDEKLLVKHAGIILLGAFLNPFFTNLDLFDGAYWKNREAQYRAVHLLKFLSTGEQQNPEFNLNLEKIICGLSPEESLPVDIVLTTDETNEAQSLLESVIEHWKVLKNTSVNGLRESFLKRDGLLKKSEMDWLLQVERKTLDVLIDSIPWGFSTLRFPWTEQKLLVEW